MRKTNSTISTNRRSKKTKITKLVAIGAILALAGCGNISETTTDTESNSATEITESNTEAETDESTKEAIGYIAETEKEKALAAQEYTNNALTELAEAEEVNIDGGIDGEEIEDTEEEDSEDDSSSSTSNKSTSSNSSSSSSSSKSSSSSSSSSSHKHSYTGKVTKAATCTSVGTITYTCSCGNSYTETIAKTDHNWVEYTYTEEVYHNAVTGIKYICGRCGEIFDTSSEAGTHIETVHAGEVASYATYNATISEAYTETVTHTGQKCSVCGATK